MKVSQRKIVKEGLWENTPVGDLDVLRLTPVNHFLDCDCDSGLNIYKLQSVLFFNGAFVEGCLQ